MYKHIMSLLYILIVMVPSNALGDQVELPNGDVYEGDFVDGLRDGRGVYEWGGW